MLPNHRNACTVLLDFDFETRLILWTKIQMLPNDPNACSLASEPIIHAVCSLYYPWYSLEDERLIEDECLIERVFALLSMVFLRR